MSYRKERYRLRFRGLSEEVQNDIKRDLPGLAAKQRGGILRFEIYPEVDMTRLYARLDTLQLGPEQLEVLASVVTARDTGRPDVPGDEHEPGARAFPRIFTKLGKDHIWYISSTIYG